MTALRKTPKTKGGNLAAYTPDDILVNEGAEILTRIGKGAHLSDWLKVGAGLYVGVKYALQFGEKRSSTYNAGMAKWMEGHPQYGEGTLDKDTRAALINLYSTPGAVQALRRDMDRMSPGELQRMATPRAAWDRVKGEFVAPKPKRVRAERGPSTVTELEGQVGELQTRLANALDLSMSNESLAEAVAHAWKDEKLRERLMFVHAELTRLITSGMKSTARKGNGKSKGAAAEPF